MGHSKAKQSNTLLKIDLNDLRQLDPLKDQKFGSGSKKQLLFCSPTQFYPFKFLLNFLAANLLSFYRNKIISIQGPIKI